MNKKLIIKFCLFVIVGLAGISWGTQAKASALMCGVLAPAVNVSSPPKNTDCLNGQNYTALTSLSSGSSSATLKTQFINKMTNFESGQNLQQVGAAFIEARIEGLSGMYWQDRLKLPDVTLDVQQYYTYTKNSAYEPLSNTDKVYSDSATYPALVFIVDGVVRLAIKLDCGNLLDDMTLPAPPIIRGYKVDDTGNINGMFSLDIMNATNSVPSNDINQPFNFSIEKNPNSASAIISPDNTTAGWTVIGSTYVSCNTAKIILNNCPVVGPSSVTLTTTSPNFAPGASRTMTGLRPGYIYDMRWVYQKVSDVTITGYKIDESGIKIGSYSSDWIRAINGSYNRPDNGQPFNITIPAGNISVTPANNITDWTVKGYSSCLGASCIPSTTPTNLVNTASFNNAKPGDVINMNWIYKCTGLSCTPIVPPQDPKICPASNVPNPPNVNVSLPDQTPTNSAPPSSTTTPNNTYLQNTSLNTTKVTNIQDISSGGNRLLSMLNLKSESYQQAVVDYMPFVLGYPYDNNQSSVSYTSAYTVTPYISSSTPSYYTCADGSTPDSSHICTSSFAIGGQHNDPVGIPKITYCTQGGSWNGTNCGTYTGSVPTVTSTCQYGGTPPCSYPATGTSVTGCYSGNTFIGGPHGSCAASGGTWTTKTQYTCPKGGSPTGSTCYYAATQTLVYPLLLYPYPASVTTYTCPNPPYTSGGGSTNICSYNDGRIVYNYTPAIAWYNYNKQTSYTKTVSNTVSGLAMTPCFSRGFSVSDVSAASANVSFNDNENPTSVNAGGYTASVKFYYTDRNPTQGLRQPMVAKLTYGYKLSPIACSNSNIPFTVTGGYAPSGPSSYSIPSAGAGCAVSVPPLTVGEKVCVTYSVSPTGSTASPDGTVGSNGSTLNSGSQCSGPVVNKPYFKVFGSDISVGGGFYSTVNGNKTCTSSNSSIFGWNTGTNSVYSNQYSGAGAQFLLSSMGSLSGAASNQNNPNASPWSSTKPDPIGLSLSNVGANPTANLYGTTLGAANCMADYYSSLPPSAQPIGSTSLSGTDGAYSMAGGSTISSSNIGPSNVPGQARRITVYVNGDLYISGDINFVGGFSTINDIPSLIIIVKDGNIYIDKSVANLSGIFIAQSTITNKGYIYDCASGFSTIANNQLYDTCGKRLTVNGSFIANKVVLNRTGNATNDKISSSLRKASPSETNTNTNATEIFNYGPAFWINTALPITTSAGTTSAGYDSIINLPPVL